ncbi:MAG TPA: M23 family metallopeptidase [Gaiellaceae bacterium]|nr:M23 family metallopeptidase [Gaiellaceae bacterium]
MRRFVVATCAFLTLAAAPAAHAVPDDGDLRMYLERFAPLELAWPATGTVTSEWGPRWGRMHLGVDIGMLQKLDVTAATGGTVTEAGWLRGYEGYGLTVLVDVGGGYEMLYAHFSSVAVKPGEWVDTGELLGKAGCTGSCTGTHLHFELRKDGKPIDPAPFMAARAVG